MTQKKSYYQQIAFAICVTTMLMASSIVYSQEIICVNNDHISNNITITWTESNNPCGPFQAYYIYGSTSASGPFTLIDSTNLITDTSYIHLAALGTGPVWYYYIVAIYDCPGFVPIPSATVNNSPPAVPIVSYVSIVNGYAELHWQPSPSPQTCFYVIYYDSIRGNSERHDTVWGRLNTTFVDSFFTYNANNEPIFYTIEANDCCGNNNGISQPSHRTIFLTNEVLRCDGKIRFSWTPYLKFLGDVKKYDLYFSKNGGPYTFGKSVDGTALSVEFDDFLDNDSLCFYIEAVAQDLTTKSRSNLNYVVPKVVQLPRFLYALNASVNDNEHIDFSWYVDTIGEMYRYLIENKTISSLFLELYDINVSRPFFYETDTLTDTLTRSDPSVKSYTYRVISDDSCDKKVKSTEVSTIHLKVTLSNYYEFTLEWTPFSIDYGRVLNYEVYRSQNGSPYTLLATLDPNSFSYIDDVSGDIDEGAQYCYKVAAKYKLTFPNGYLLTTRSFSNRGCLVHRPIVFIPNAFVPEGVNKIFKPSIIFNDVSGYSMIIFNRWGEQIFVSNEYANGWDGTMNGQDSPAGGYAYLIRFNGLDGNVNEYKGIVLLVR